jgi:hypothetical protein
MDLQVDTDLQVVDTGQEDIDQLEEDIVLPVGDIQVGIDQLEGDIVLQVVDILVGIDQLVEDTGHTLVEDDTDLLGDNLS